MNFYIGQEVVILIDAPPLCAFKRGDTRFILAARKNRCGCANTEYDLGITHPLGNGGLYCSSCGRSDPRDAYPTVWFYEYEIAPLADISELKEILETKVEEWGAGNTYPKRIIDL